MFVQSQFSTLLENQLLSDTSIDYEAEQVYLESLTEPVVWVEYRYWDWDEE